MPTRKSPKAKATKKAKKKSTRHSWGSYSKGKLK